MALLGVPGLPLSIRSERGLVALGVVGVVLGLAISACGGGGSAGQVPESPSRSTSSSPTQSPTVGHTAVRLPAALGGKPRAIRGVPSSFPSSIESLPALTFDGRANAFTLAYRPYESSADGTGWGSEETALLSADGRWFRLRFEDLDLRPDTWRGPDTIGPGQLNSRGDALAIVASSGAIVVDLRTGKVRRVLEKAGHLGLIQWAPGADILVASAPRSSEDYQVDLTTAEQHRSAIPGPALGFGPGGRRCSTLTRQDGNLVLRCWAASGKLVQTAVLPLGGETGRVPFQNWGLGHFVAVRKLGGNAIHVYSTSDSRLVSTLQFSRRTAAYLSVHGWIDRHALLLSMDRALLTWNPQTSQVVKIATLPISDFKQAQGSVGITFPPLPLR